MNWKVTENNSNIKLRDIPTVNIEDIRNDIISSNRRVIGFFGNKEEEKIRLYIITADDTEGKIYVSSVLFAPETKEYESFTRDIPSFHMFEREFYEEYKIEPKNHPWLKPVRKNQDKYEFFKMQGEDVHEVAVGPIHAGVIEPGHFRFMCQGEKVYELEIMLGYQHRGIEKLFLGEINSKKNKLAESICGDRVIAHNTAYSQVIESLTETKITQRAKLIRRIALEMERIAIHIGDMGAIAGDMAYLTGASIFGTTRTLVINTMLEISGSRFGRGLVEIGGVNFDINKEMSDKIEAMLDKVEKIVDRTVSIMLRSPSCISRMEKTGIVTKEIAKSLGAVGMAARSSGMDIDCRFDFKDELYNKNEGGYNYKASGDVDSRFKQRYKEVKDSVIHIKNFLNKLKNYEEEELKIGLNEVNPDTMAISAVEGWRGEIVHIALVGGNSEIIRYKIKDPSFNNWYMLAMAVRDNGISDFPLCNKSFNLSYSGNDL